MSFQRMGPFEIETEIGRGGMAAVFRAHDPRFRRDVAIKVLPRELLHEPSFRARFEREAQTVAALEHPAIVPVYDYGEEDGLPYIVMRFMPGGSLSERLESGSMSVQESERIITRLAAALDEAHRQGIVHRDLKPANILFDRYGNAYLSDFGVARIAQASAELTGDAIVGTPAYMSPEQARGETDLDGRSDVYALGAILFEMLTGQQPFEADTPLGVAMKHITEPVPRIREVKADLPAACEALIERSMAKDREARFDTAGDLAAALTAIAGAVPPPHPGGDLYPSSEPFFFGEKPDSTVSTVSDPAVPGAAGGAHGQGGRFPTIPPWAWLLTFLVLASGVCGLFTLGGGALAVLQQLSNPPASTAPVSAPQSPATPAAAIFRDDFSEASSGWDGYRDEEGWRDYDQNGYRIQIQSPNYYYWSNPGLFLTDVSVEVDARKLGGPDENEFGIICRYQDNENFYFFVAGNDGAFSVNKYAEGELSLVGMEAARYHESIRRGRGVNRLRFECVDDRLRAYANEVLLIEVRDGDLASGDVGLIAGTFEEPGTDVLFDDFAVRRP